MADPNNRAGRVVGIALVFGIIAALAYWLYLFSVEGSAPSFGDLWNSIYGGFTGVAGIGKLQFADLQTFASNAGFSGDDLNMACAIALAESSGNPNAVGDLNVTPGGSIGLWQVNLKAHPEYTASQLRDPQTNANAAYAIYQAAGNSFSPWSTFNSGAYSQYLPASSSTSVAEVPTSDSSTDSTIASYDTSDNLSEGDETDV